jgi:hypothetical protein
LLACNALAVVVEFGFDSKHRVAKVVAFGHDCSNIDLVENISVFKTKFATDFGFGYFLVSRRGLRGDLSVT